MALQCNIEKLKVSGPTLEDVTLSFLAYAGHESKQFLSYFRNGLRLLNGGFESGFHKVTNELEPALYQIKGKKRPLMHECNEVSWSSMNNGDVFLLVVPKYIFVWTGKASNRFERLAAINTANELKNELARFHLSTVIIDDGQENDQLSDDESSAFNQLLPIADKEGKLKKADAADWTSDEKFESSERQFVHLYRCKEISDQIHIGSVKDGPLSRADLDSNVSTEWQPETTATTALTGAFPLTQDTFIVDNGANGLWVWVGRDATTKERSQGLKYAMELIKKNGYPNKTEVTKVIEGGETVEFKSLFKQWSGNAVAANSEKHARLFNLQKNGKFSQVVQFEKHDLEEDSAMILGESDW